MGAGMSRKQITARIYRRLKSIEFALSKAGVNVIYKRGDKARYAELVFEEKNILIDGGFNVRFVVSRASNGECAGFPLIYVVLQGVTRKFGWQEKDGEFTSGIKFLKENFGCAAREAKPDPLKIALNNFPDVNTSDNDRQCRGY